MKHPISYTIGVARVCPDPPNRLATNAIFVAKTARSCPFPFQVWFVGLPQTVKTFSFFFWPSPNLWDKIGFPASEDHFFGHHLIFGMK